jgi:hypothetical protein
VKLYRIEVTTWPTESGYPWDRFVDVDEAERWLLKLADEGKLEDYERHTSSDYSGEILLGWVLPATHKRHYLSRAAAYAWLDRATALGAVAQVIESNPITWEHAA